MPHRLGFCQPYRFALWILGATLAAGLIAWIAAGLQVADRAPLGLFSLAVGLAVGGATVGTARLLRLPRWKGDTWVVGVLVVVLVAAEHALVYRELYEQYVVAWEEHRQATPSLAIFRPEEGPLDFRSFVSTRLAGTDRGGDDAFRKRWPLWLLDWILVTGSALTVVWASRPSADVARGDDERV